MLMSAILRCTLLILGCSAIVLFGATPTDRSSPPKSASPPTLPVPVELPTSDARHSVVKLSEAEVAEALKIMKQLDDNPLAGTLMDQPPAAGSSTEPVEPPPEKSTTKTPAQPVDLLREIAGRVDAMANRLEAEDLYEGADQLRGAADRLRRQARRIRQTEPQPDSASPVFTRRPSRRFPRR